MNFLKKNSTFHGVLAGFSREEKPISNEVGFLMNEVFYLQPRNNGKSNGFGQHSATFRATDSQKLIFFFRRSPTALGLHQKKKRRNSRIFAALRIMTSQVTGGLEIPTPCHTESNPSFWRGVPADS